MNRDFAAHLEALLACRACPNVMGTPVTGPVPDARVMLVGQAPGPREELFAWFERFVGIDEEGQVRFMAKGVFTTEAQRGDGGGRRNVFEKNLRPPPAPSVPLW